MSETPTEPAVRPAPRFRVSLRVVMLAVVGFALVFALVRTVGDAIAVFLGGLCVPAVIVLLVPLPREPLLGRVIGILLGLWTTLGLLVVAAIQAWIFAHVHPIIAFLFAFLYALFVLYGSLLWLRLATRPWAAPRRSRPQALVRVAAAVGLASSLLWPACWPFQLAFRISRPALDALADRVEEGRPVVLPAQAGMFRIQGASCAYFESVTLYTDGSSSSDGCAFARSRTPGGAWAYLYSPDRISELPGGWAFFASD